MSLAALALDFDVVTTRTHDGGLTIHAPNLLFVRASDLELEKASDPAALLDGKADQLHKQLLRRETP